MRFNVQDKNFLVDYQDRDEEKENQLIDAFTKVIDQGPISRDAYRNLAALQPELSRDHHILDARKRINEEMNQKIPISILNVINPTLITINENSDIEDQEIIDEVLKYIGKAGYRQILDIILYAISNLIHLNVLY